MAQTLNLKVAGLHTYNNPLSSVPQGALRKALNLMITRQNIAESRRGFTPSSYALPSDTDRIDTFIEYDGYLFGHYNNTTLGKYDPSSGWSSSGSIVRPTNARELETVVANDNLYVSSSTGLKKLDGHASSLYQAGLPKGTMVELSLASGTGTAVENTKYVTYRYIICRYDANENLVIGGVSGRYSIQNTSGSVSKDITVKQYLPSGLSTSHFIRTFRTFNLDTEGSDEMFLCYEKNIESADISAGYLEFTDIVPDSLLGETLYTSPSQPGGISADNTEPPLANHIELYQDHLFFADVQDKNRFTFTIVACGGSEGIVNTDTMTITDGAVTEVYTASSSFDVSTKTYIVDTASSSFAIRNTSTAASLVKLINLASTKWSAFLVSTGSDLPGKIMIESRSLGEPQFTVTSTRAGAYSPPLESTATASQKSDKSEAPNGLRFSKQGIHEAVPLVNFLRVGNSSRILGIKALQNGLFIFKETDGIFVLRGDVIDNFTLNPLDVTANLVAQKTLRVLNNQIYGLFEAGIGQVSDTGVSYIHTAIRDRLLPLYAEPLPELRDQSFAIPYETEGKYIISLPDNASDPYTSQQYIYDIFGSTWSEWDLELTAGIIFREDGKMYIAPVSDTIKIERKLYDYTDYCDKIKNIMITSYSGTTLVVSDVTLMTIGDLLLQSDLNAYILEIDVNANTVVIDYEQAWTTGVATVELLAGIDCQIEWITETAGNPGGFKQFYEGSLFFQQKYTQQAAMYFYSDENPAESTFDLTARSGNGAWGSFIWGEEVWGGEQTETTKRFGIPRPHSRCNNLSVRFQSRAAFNDFRVAGISLVYNPVSSRTTR